MDIIVTPNPSDPTRGHVRWLAHTAPCALGRNGIIAESDKREGDGATPAGQFALRRVLWRPDRGAAPKTALPSKTIGEDEGWCDDPARPEYNHSVRLPFAGSAERLWRDDDLYNVVVVLGHNDAPPQPGRGSAIFLHVAGASFKPTEGCVAMAESDLRALLVEVQSGDVVRIEMPSAP